MSHVPRQRWINISTSELKQTVQPMIRTDSAASVQTRFRSLRSELRVCLQTAAQWKAVGRPDKIWPAFALRFPRALSRGPDVEKLSLSSVMRQRGRNRTGVRQ